MFNKTSNGVLRQLTLNLFVFIPNHTCKTDIYADISQIYTVEINRVELRLM